MLCLCMPLLFYVVSLFCFIIVSTEQRVYSTPNKDMCCRLVKQHKIYLNETKCKEMHSRSTTLCMCVMCMFIFLLNTNFLVSKKERVKKKKLITLFFCLLRTQQCIVIYLNLLRLERIIFSPFFFLPHLCFYLFSRKRWI